MQPGRLREILPGGPKQSRIRGGKRGQLPRPPAAMGPPRWNLFVSNKIIVWKMFVIQKWYKTTTLYCCIFLCSVKYQGPPTATDFSTSGMGNLITIAGRMNCALSLACHKINFILKFYLYLWGRVASFELLSKYLLIMLLHFDKILYFDLGTRFRCGPYQMFTRAEGSPPLLYMFDSLPVLVIATARPPQPIPVRPWP